MPDIVPTRSAFLELRDERGGMREGYRFLDEKRLVLAGEIVERLDAYAAAKKDFERLQKEAVQALRTAVEQHGLAELTFYPAQHPINAKVRTDSRNILGVMATSAELSTGRTETEPAVFASPPADACRQCFQSLIEAATAMAAAGATLLRLWREYNNTSRRARALEQVLLPETEHNLRLIESSLDEQEREEAIRVRHFREKRDQ